MCKKITKAHLFFKISLLFVKLFSVGLIVLGVVIVSRYETEAKELRLAWNKSLKPGQEKMTHQKALDIVVLVSISCIAIGVLGLVAAFTLNLCLTIIFTVVIVIVFLPLLAFTFIYIILFISISAALIMASLVITPFMIALSIIISGLYKGTKTLIPCA